jgi:predicted transcriptional regulator
MKKPSLSPRTTTLSVRLEPRTRFALELLARRRRSTITAVLEAAIDRIISDPEEGLFDTPAGERGKPENIVDKVWDTDDADRLVKLSMYFPRLLTFEQERLVKMIRENPRLWPAKGGPNFKAIREEWDDLRTEYLSPGG